MIAASSFCVVLVASLSVEDVESVELLVVALGGGPGGGGGGTESADCVSLVAVLDESDD